MLTSVHRFTGDDGELMMSRITLLGLLGAMLAMVVAAGAFEITRLEQAQQHSALAEPIDAAILTTHLQNLRGESALP